MNSRSLHVRAMLALAALAVLSIVSLSFLARTADAPAWQAVNAQVPVGKDARIEVKLTGIAPLPAAADITVTASRIDMGPDGMAAMDAPLKALPSAAPGVLAFQTELAMAGRWALAITADVKGQARPVAGTVIFTAVEKTSEAPSDGAIAKRDRKILYYRNPMGAPDISPVPKKDSMGMDYIPVYEDEMSGPQGTVRLSPEKVQRAGVRVAPAKRQVLTRIVRTTGTVVLDETRTGTITAKFNGFVEELYVAASGEEVRKGQPLMRVWIESPEILQRQADLTSALAGGPRSAIGPDTAERNLRFFGFTDEAIGEIRKAGRPLRSITFHAPRAGIVMEKPALAGMRFSGGDTLFRTADLSVVWVIAQIPERDLAFVKLGQKAQVTLKAWPEEAREGRVALIYPELNMAARTVPVRIELPNPDGRLRAGLFADVALEGRMSDDAVVAIPDSAVIDSGTRRVAFVAKGEGLFEPRNLTLGPRAGGLVEIREGIAEGEEIVVAGNFLIDAESNLKAALSAFTSAERQK
jgi:Cu(I)/Ag(I) efflux system membrane fusion protein